MTGTDYVARHAGLGRAISRSRATPIFCALAAFVGVAPTSVFGEDIPYPPIVELPPEIVQPSADIPAQKWRALYCLAWEDGCTECRRTTLMSDVLCKEKISDKLFCTHDKRFSICTHDEALGSFCSSAQYYVINPSDYDGRNLEEFLKRHREGQAFEFAWDFDDTLPGAWYARDLSTLPGRLGPNRSPAVRTPDRTPIRGLRCEGFWPPGEAARLRDAELKLLKDGQDNSK